MEWKMEKLSAKKIVEGCIWLEVISGPDIGGITFVPPFVSETKKAKVYDPVKGFVEIEV